MFNKIKKIVITTVLIAAPLTASETFGGIGISIYQVHDGVKIIDIIPGTPAAESKLKTGNVILSVDGENLKGKSIEESKELLRGLKSKPLEITFLNQGDTLSTTLRRAEITVVNLKKEYIESRNGLKSGYDITELQDCAESIEKDKQFIAILKNGSVIKFDATTNAESLKGIFVTQADEFAPKAKKSFLNSVSSIHLKSVSRTTIIFFIETAGRVTISVASANGTFAVRFVRENIPSGYNSLNLDLEKIPNGRYTVSVEHNGVVSSKNILLK